MKYFSMFSGIGGFELGIQQAYEKLSNRDRHGGLTEDSNSDRRKLSQGHGNEEEPSDWQNESRENSCIGYSEIDKYAIEIYEKHFNHKNYGDATKLITADLPDFDFLVGGFPCQSFSLAGKRKGFNDTRGTLFFEVARVLRDKRPRYLLLENVKGLLSHDEGKTFQTILGVLTEIGYQLEWQILNSKNFGVPQNRERVFIAGYLGKGSRPKVFPIERSDGTDNRVITEIDTGHQGNSVYRADGIATTLNANGGGQGGKTGLYATGIMIKEATKKGYAEDKKGDSINLSVPNSKTRRGRVGKEIAQTIDTGMQQHTLQGTRIRRLTPTECERLQGFPDGWTEGLSDTQRYKCLGNAVTVNVIEAIIHQKIK